MNGPDPTRAEREERLGEIISDWLESREAGVAADPSEWLARYPEFAEELREFLTEEAHLRLLAAPLRRAAQEARVDTPLPWGALFAPGPRSVTPGDQEFSPALGEYELLEEIGRGGMAVVYRARQKSLARFVALKLFRAESLNRTDELQRFRHEAEIVAALDHPQIVPVYAVGETSGQGFFTMKLMEGGGLDAQLVRFAADPSAAAGLLASVARAIHHAHQRGILHRDLKPSNILLSGSPDTPPAQYVPHVSDFGLAKRLGKEPDLTRSGAVVGTPAYMAPEQASGSKSAITTATDVYGLGAVLYALLSGRAPFCGGSLLDVLARVKEQDPEPLRQINPRVPQDLETICLKCLHKEPHRRYESALEVAEDLDRWLRGEPITARPVGAPERLWRWARRQPVQASLAVALVLTGLVGFGLVFWQWRRAETNLAAANTLRLDAENNLATMTVLRQNAETARVNAETARQDALNSKNESDTSFQLAHQAVREITELLEEDGQLESHGLDPLHRKVLLRSQAYFKRFLEYRGQDPTLRRALAQASATLADVIRQTGSLQKALEAYEQAIALSEALRRDDPDGATVNQALAQLHNHIAAVHDVLGHREEALASLKRAGAVLEKALARHPADRALLTAQATTQHNLGTCYTARNRIGEALVCYTEARRGFEKLLKLQPDDAVVQGLLANALNSIAIVQNGTGQFDEAVRTFQKAIELSAALTQKYPERRLAKQGLALELCNLGEALFRHGEPKKALEPLEQARGILDELVRTSPSVTDFHALLGRCHAIRAQVQGALGDPARACESLESARVIYRRLVGAHPKVIDYHHKLIDVLIDLAGRRQHLKQRERTFETYGEARAVAARLVEAHPDEPDYLGWLGAILNNRALAEAEMVSLEDARTSVLEAIGYHERAFTRRETELLYRGRLGVSYALLAAIERDLGHTDDAVGANKKRRALWLNDGDELYVAALDFVRIGDAAKADAAKQRQCYTIAVETLQWAVRAGFRNAEAVMKEPLLAPLRTRGDFQKLVEEITKTNVAPPPRERAP
jgi:serine/threonine-protein kinase